jgi:Cytochrome C'
MSKVAKKHAATQSTSGPQARCRRVHTGPNAVRTALISLGLLGICQAQPPAPKGAKAPASAALKPEVKPEVTADLRQLMRGILFPSSNVIFAAQDDDPAKVPPAKDPALSPNPLASTYGGWMAVENSALALSEAANLLILPGRKCANGLPVPMNNPDWPKFVQGLREASLATYKAAQSKNQDNILTAAGDLTTACSNCHDKYREKPTLADRCK